MPFGENPATTTGGGEAVEGVFYLILTIAVFCLDVYYLMKYRSDLYGRRDGIKHLVKKDAENISGNYRLMENLRMTGIVSLSLALIFGCFAHNFWPLGVECISITQLTMVVWQFGKAMLHLTIVVALHTNFHGFPNTVKYSSNKLLFVSAMTIAANSICGTGLVVAVNYSTDIRGDSDEGFPFHCFAYVSDPKWRIIFGIGMIIYDGFFAVFSIKAFNMACKALNELDENNKSDDAALKLAKYNGQKYKSAVTTTAISTLVWILVALCGAPQFIVTPLYCVDVFIGVIALWLLAPYSNNDSYYKKVCSLCRLCYGTDTYFDDAEDAVKKAHYSGNDGGDNKLEETGRVEMN